MLEEAVEEPAVEFELVLVVELAVAAARAAELVEEAELDEAELDVPEAELEEVAAAADEAEEEEEEEGAAVVDAGALEAEEAGA